MASDSSENIPERRLSVRVSAEGRALDVQPHDFRHVAARDVSRTGLAFYYPEKVNPGQMLDLRVREDDGPGVPLKCRVVRCEELADVEGEERFLVGAAFMDMDAIVDRALTALRKE